MNNLHKIFFVSISILTISSGSFSQTNNQTNSADINTLEERINSNQKSIEKLDNENTENKKDLEKKVDDLKDDLNKRVDYIVKANDDQTSATRWFLTIVVALFSIVVAIAFGVINRVSREKIKSTLEAKADKLYNEFTKTLIQQKKDFDTKTAEFEKLLNEARGKHSEIETITISSKEMVDRMNMIMGVSIIDNISPTDKKEMRKLEKELRETKVEDEYTYYDWYLRGINSYDEKNYEAAVYYFTKAIELNPNDFLIYNSRGNTYSRLKEYDKVIKDYNKAIELKPDDAFAYNERGNLYSMLKEYDKAINDYNRANEINPNKTLILINLGITYFKKRDLENSLKYFKKVLERDTKNYTAQLGIARNYYLMNDKAKAKEEFQIAKELEPRLKEGMTGIEKLEIEEDISWSDDTKEILRKMFEEL